MELDTTVFKRIIMELKQKHEAKITQALTQMMHEETARFNTLNEECLYRAAVEWLKAKGLWEE